MVAIKGIGSQIMTKWMWGPHPFRHISNSFVNFGIERYVSFLRQRLKNSPRWGVGIGGLWKLKGPSRLLSKTRRTARHVTFPPTCDLKKPVPGGTFAALAARARVHTCVVRSADPFLAEVPNPVLARATVMEELMEDVFALLKAEDDNPRARAAPRRGDASAWPPSHQPRPYQPAPSYDGLFGLLG